jgi:hypothetical protein
VPVQRTTHYTEAEVDGVAFFDSISSEVIEVTFTGILVGTAILWGLSALVVQPIASYLLTRKLKGDPEYALALASGDAQIQLDEGKQKYIQSQATKYFVLADVGILAVAGFLIGLLSGYFFIGFSWKAKYWPGMAAFILSSVGGAVLNSGAM